MTTSHATAISLFVLLSAVAWGHGLGPHCRQWSDWGQLTSYIMTEFTSGQRQCVQKGGTQMELFLLIDSSEIDPVHIDPFCLAPSVVVIDRFDCINVI